MLKLIGIAILVFIALQLLGVTNGNLSKRGIPLAGAVVGFLSGLIGTAGPLGAAVFMSLNLSPLTYISTDAFSSLVMHMVKALVYHQNGGETAALSLLTIAMSLMTILGTLVGNKIAKRIPQQIFKRAVLSLVVFAAFEMILQANST